MFLNILLAIVVSASIDSTTLMIGDQTDLHLSVTHEAGEQVEWPVFGEQLQEGIEIVDKTIVDTLQLSDGRVQEHQYLTLTSFKDSLFSIEPIAVVSGGDTFFTEPMALNIVQPFEVDSSLAITDIKDIEKAPIYWWGIIRWILLALALVGLAIGGYYGWQWYQKHRKKEEEPVDPELLRPADEVALEKLDAIKEAKIWKDGKVKEYQTELTDVVREYISRRFDVQSTEKTSDETLKEVKPLLVNGDLALEDGKELYERLSKMLRTADLVKFAKWHTTPDENEQALTTAYDFVKETSKPENPDLQENPDKGKEAQV
ncbi:MAG: hypothetical protein IJ249_07465 [Paludibacteraceae bacterium]|nr:hypothetical protein [Paludibacteraceae bacterium]